MSLGGGSKQPTSQKPTKALGIDFQSAQYGPCIPVGYGRNRVKGNVIWYGDFQAIAVQQKQSSGKGGGGSTTTTSYTYKASYMLGLTEGVAPTLRTIYNGSATVGLSDVNGTYFTGAFGQAPWAHLSGDAAVGYSLTAYVAFQNRDLGSSASLPNDNFELDMLKQVGGAIVDADPSQILSDICTDPYHGIGFSALGDLTQMQNYCYAMGIFMSPVYDTQGPASQVVSDLLKYTNCDAWFSEGQLKVGCYGDTEVTGNGKTYVPVVEAEADLTDDDFITNGTDDPVRLTRTAPADSMNIVRVEFKDRSNSYHDSVAVASFDNDINIHGARSDDDESVDMITQATVARVVAQNLLQRQYYVRNQYEFKLSWRYCYLEPFDIVTLTETNLGLQRAPVRILSVEEDENGQLDIVAEEFPEGIGHSSAYNADSSAGTVVDPNADPGAVAAPYLMRAPGFLVGNDAPEIWAAVTGINPLWAACDVYLSLDGSTYNYVSTFAKQSRYGELTNAIGVEADPDTVSVPNVVLNGSAQLLGGTQADADNFNTLCMIDSEVVSYEHAVLASGPSYNLSYLRRGGYGTTKAAHAIGAPFVRLDDNILRIKIDPSLVGSTVHIKFLSINCFGRTPRTLAEETAYAYVVGTNVELPDVPVVPDGFSVTPVADGVSLIWSNDNPAAVGCTSIEYATASTGPWTVLAQVGPTTTGYPHHFTNGSTYYYRLRSRGPLLTAGWSGYTAVISSTGKTVENGATNGFNKGANLLFNPSGVAGFSGWPSFIGGTQQSMTTVVEQWPGFACTLTASSADQGIQQIVQGNFSGAAFTISGLIYNFHMLTGTTVAQLRFLNSSGGEIDSTNRPAIVASNGVNSAEFYQATGVAPVGTTQIAVSLRATGTGNGLTRWYQMKLEQDTAATPFNSICNPGDQLTNPGSGYQIGNQLNLLPINWNGVRSVLNTSPLTYSINTATPAGLTFNCAAVTVRGGSGSVSYNASSASTTQARGTTVTYYFYYIDQASAGGSQTLHFTTNVYDLSAQDGIVNIGNCSITVPSSGGGSGAGSGGGGWCVCEDMFVDEDTLASEADIGHLFDCCDWPTSRERTFKRRLQSVEYHDTECVRITTDGGAVLECGITTPFDLLRDEGGTKRAPDMLGEKVLTDHGIETVIEVKSIGISPVCFFHFGGISYAAGADPCHRIFSHNTGTQKP